MWGVDACRRLLADGRRLCGDSCSASQGDLTFALRAATLGDMKFNYGWVLPLYCLLFVLVVLLVVVSA